MIIVELKVAKAIFYIAYFVVLEFRLEVAAANKLQELRMWTRAGLEYAITQHEVHMV